MFPDLNEYAYKMKDIIPGTVLFSGDKNGLYINAKACEYMEKALEVGGDNYDYLLELGLYYKRRNLVAKSIEVTQKAVNMNPDYFLGYAYLAGMYDEMEDFDNEGDFFDGESDLDEDENEKKTKTKNK